MTTAQKIANLFDNDGQNWKAVINGVAWGLEEYCLERRASADYEHGHGTGTVRYGFADGSAIIVAEGCWDLALSADEDCFCMAGNKHCCCRKS